MTHLPYYLPKTSVRIRGEVTTAMVSRGERQIVQGEVAVDLLVGADANAVRSLDPASSGVADHEITVGFTPDGRLLTTEGTATGKLGSVVTNLAKFSVGLVGAVAPAALSPAAAAVGLMSHVAAREGEEAEGLAQRPPALKQIEDVIAELRTRLAVVEQGAGQDDGSDTGARAIAIVAALARLEVQRTELNAEFEAAQAEVREAQTTNVDLSIPIEDLPTQEFDGDSLPEAPDADNKAARLLALSGVAVHVRQRPAMVGGSPSATECCGIEYRVPRPIELLVYRSSPGTPRGAPALRLEGVYPIAVFDERSRVGCIDLKNPVLSKHTTKATFGGAGHLDSASSAESSALEGISEELGKLPETVSGALKTANMIVEEQQKLAAAPLQSRIDELENRVKLAEQQRELIEARAALRDGGLIGELASETEILKLRNELDAVRLTQLKNQQEIAQLQETGSD